MKYLGALVLFGSNGIVASAIDLPSYQIVLLRTLLGATLLVVLFILMRKKITLQKSPRDVVFVSVSGVAMGVCWVFVYMAYREVGVGITSLLYALGPVVVMMASPLLFKERMTVGCVFCFVIVVVGAVLANGPIAESKTGALGLVHGCTAALAYAAMIVFCKKAKTGSGLECSAVQLVAATITAALAIVVQGEQIIPIPVTSIAPVLVLGLVNTGIGCYLYFSSIGNLSAQTVAVCDYVEPLTAVLLASVLLDEVLSPFQWLGAVLVVVGAVACELVRRRHA